MIDRDLGGRTGGITNRERTGADSMALLADAAATVASEGWTVANVDCTVILEAPKLTPRQDEMQAVLTTAVGGPVTVKGKRAEGLGALGRQEGVACFAVALLLRQEGLPQTEQSEGDGS